MMSFLPLSADLQALVAGTATARRQVETLIERIRARESGLRIWAAFDEARALRLADACDATARDDAHPLRGVPFGVKDIIDTADLPTRRGSRAYADRQPERDAEVVTRLRRAGAFVLGKSQTTELAFMEPAITRNPWNTAHTPGGSSSGSAAGVGAGFFPAAIGTQTNGSVIRPAAFCGVVGFKPTGGVLPAAGVLTFSETLDQLGTFARCVADVAHATAPLVEGEALAGRVRELDRPPRIALLARFPWNAPTDEAAAHLDATAAKLRAAGAVVTPLAVPDALADGRDVQRTVMLFEAIRHHRALQDRARELLGTQTNAGLDEARGIAAADYAGALARRAAITERAFDLFEHCDAVAALPAPGDAPDSLAMTGDPSFCTLWSLTGFPAITVPSGLSARGLPLGLQLAAPAGADDLLLAVAGWCETVLSFRARAPGAA
jgi:Asp-tRNA(Asn)/Glu-tRNA(Gln) amidotransferase A subunit family amidase